MLLRAPGSSRPVQGGAPPARGPVGVAERARDRVQVVVEPPLGGAAEIQVRLCHLPQLGDACDTVRVVGVPEPAERLLGLARITIAQDD